MSKSTHRAGPPRQRGDDLDHKLAWASHTDMGNAERLALRFGKRIKYVINEGWRYYDGRCWRRDEGEIKIRSFAMQMARLMKKEAEALARGGEDNAKLLIWARKSEANRAISAAISLAQVHCSALASDFDKDPLALNVANGTLKFRVAGEGAAAVTLQHHRAEDMISHIANASFEPNAKAPHWSAHLSKMIPDPEVEDFVQRAFGYMLTGLTREDAIFVFQGRGSDGKTTTTKHILAVAGTYGRTADVQLFLVKKGSDANAASPALARLAGDVRCVSTSEPNKGARLDDGFIKLVTGGGRITARALNKDVIEFEPRFKVVLEANSFPFVAGEDKAMWRRLHIVQWTNSLKSEERDRQLDDKLKKERSGILNWIVHGVIRYLEIGLAPPDAVRVAGDNYRAISDSYGEWMEECVEFDPEAECEQVALYESYAAWCIYNGIEPMRAQTFYGELTNQQINQVPAALRRSPGRRRVLRAGVRVLPSGDAARTSPRYAGVRGR